MNRANMHKKLFSAAILLMLVLTVVSIKPASSQAPFQTILIRPDGTIYPSTAAIQRNGNIYTFTDNIYAAVKIQKSDIVLDGAGHALWGPYSGEESDLWFIGSESGQQYNSTQKYIIGVDLGSSSVEGVVIENLNIKNFSIGMYMWTKNNTVVRNAISENVIGILLSGSNSTIIENYIANNQRGLFFGFNNPGDIIPSDIHINQNSFKNNIIQLNGCECKNYNTTESPHNWDNGKAGNYWSDYNGSDTNGDGVGDTPYAIDVLNQDRYPLMESTVQPPVPAGQISTELVVFFAALIAIVVFVFLGLRRVKKRI